MIDESLRLMLMRLLNIKEELTLDELMVLYEQNPIKFEEPEI